MHTLLFCYESTLINASRVATVAANACVDYLSMYAFSPSLQCVWVRCDKALFGFREDFKLCAAYINPQSQAFTLAHITDSFSSLFDELACATQVAPHFLLCGDFNAKVGGLSEVSHAHDGAPCPATGPSL